MRIEFLEPAREEFEEAVVFYESQKAGLGPTLQECSNELRSTLEDWVVLGLKLGHPLSAL